MKTHGLSKTILYSKYVGMKSRCYNQNEKNFIHYGGRGIRVCQQWLDDFMNFHEWAISSGYKPGLTIERIDVDGNYQPENCIWATWKEQANNKSNNAYLTYRGTTKTLTQWCDLLNLDYARTKARIKKGWTVNRAFETKMSTSKKCNNVLVTVKGTTLNFSEMCRKYNIAFSTAKHRVDKGMPMELVFTSPVRKNIAS